MKNVILQFKYKNEFGIAAFTLCILPIRVLEYIKKMIPFSKK